MSQRDLVIVCVFIGALSFALAWWSWVTSSHAYQRNDSAPLHTHGEYIPPP